MKVKQIVIYGLLAALCGIGGHIHIGVYSIGFDAMPAFIGAFVLGPWGGAILGVLGHAITAATTGFPLGIVLHTVVAMVMGITCALMSYTFSRRSSWFSYVLSGIVGYIVNVGVGLGLTVMIVQQVELAYLLWLPLSLTYVANYVGAVLVASQLKKLQLGVYHA